MERDSVLSEEQLSLANILEGVEMHCDRIGKMLFDFFERVSTNGCAQLSTLTDPLISFLGEQIGDSNISLHFQNTNLLRTDLSISTTGDHQRLYYIAFLLSVQRVHTAFCSLFRHFTSHLILQFVG